MPPSQPKRENPIEQEIEPHRQKAYEHRGLAPVERVERVHQHLERGVPGKPDGIESQRTGGLRRLIGVEFSVLVEHRDDRLGEHHEPDGRGNREQQRDPEMHQTRKGRQWYFGMKAHVGVDSKTKLIHTALVTPAHVADATVLPELLHGEETRVWGDQAYRGQTDVIHQCAPEARDCTHRRYRFKYYTDEVEREKNRVKSTVRSKVEHVFGGMKLKFGFVKVRYRGLAKNANRLFATCALVNLYMVRKKLLYAVA